MSRNGNRRLRPLALAVSLAAAAACASGTGRRDAPPREPLVGVYYFAGWWPEAPSKYVVGGADWRPDHPGRAALLGEYNDQATLDREIDAAADHGVDFFQILWYPPTPGSPDPNRNGRLNAAVDQFMASPRRDRLRFTIEYVNHAPFEIRDPAAWAETCRAWAAVFRHPSYLRVGGRPLFKVHYAQGFLHQCGGTPAAPAAWIRTLREVARAAGAGDPLVVGGIVPGEVLPAAVAEPYDALASYMNMPDRPKRDAPYPYEDLVAFAEDAWRGQIGKGTRPYIPYVPAGWDPRPWRDPRPSFESPSRAQWTDALRRARQALDAHEQLGVRTPDGRRVKMLLIYAWNEFGEGGIVAPTRGDGWMKLEAIRDVFGG